MSKMTMPGKYVPEADIREIYPRIKEPYVLPVRYSHGQHAHTSVNSVYIREKFDIIHGHIPWQGISCPTKLLTFPMCKSSLSWRKLTWCMFANALTSTMYKSYGHVAHGHTSLAIRMVILFLCISPGYLPQGHIYPALLIFTLNTDILIFNIPRVYNV